MSARKIKRHSNAANAAKISRSKLESEINRKKNDKARAATIKTLGRTRTNPQYTKLGHSGQSSPKLLL